MPGERSVIAVYDGAVLRPEEPIDLIPNTRVRITVEPVTAGKRPAKKVRAREWVSVDSSMIEAVRYDELEQTLEVLFTSGKTYCYYEVPRETYDDLMAAGSKGQYMRYAIIDVFPESRGTRRRGR